MYYRVQIDDDGGCIVEPVASGTFFPTARLPSWQSLPAMLRNALAVLRFVDVGVRIPNFGVRVSDREYLVDDMANTSFVEDTPETKPPDGIVW